MRAGLGEQVEIGIVDHVAMGGDHVAPQHAVLAGVGQGVHAVEPLRDLVLERAPAEMDGNAAADAVCGGPERLELAGR